MGAVVCATDFSGVAGQGATVAALIAARSRSPLILVHVLEHATAEAERLAAGNLEQEAARLRALGAEVETQLVRGRPQQGLCKVIRARRGELLIAGAPPHDPPLHRTRGTVPRVARTLRVPLLAVREAAPFEAWLRQERRLRVVLGLDASSASAAARRFVEELRGLGPLEVVAATVVWPSQECRRRGIRVPPPELDFTPELAHALDEELEDQAGPLTRGEPFHTHLEAGAGHPGGHLVAAARAEGADLLVVGRGHRKLVQKLVSVSHYALRSAPMAVVSVPRESLRAREHAPLRTTNEAGAAY